MRPQCNPNATLMRLQSHPEGLTKAECRTMNAEWLGRAAHSQVHAWDKPGNSQEIWRRSVVLILWLQGA